jgi:hypothetical protein
LELLEGLQEQIVPSAQFSATLPPCLLSAFAKPFSPPVPQRGKPGGGRRPLDPCLFSPSRPPKGEAGGQPAPCDPWPPRYPRQFLGENRSAGGRARDYRPLALHPPPSLRRLCFCW